MNNYHILQLFRKSLTRVGQVSEQENIIEDKLNQVKEKFPQAKLAKSKQDAINFVIKKGSRDNLSKNYLFNTTSF